MLYWIKLDRDQMFNHIGLILFGWISKCYLKSKLPHYPPNIYIVVMEAVDFYLFLIGILEKKMRFIGFKI